MLVIVNDTHGKVIIKLNTHGSDDVITTMLVVDPIL